MKPKELVLVPGQKLRVGRLITAAGLAAGLLLPAARAGAQLPLALLQDEVHSLEQEFRHDLHMLDEFAGRRSSGTQGGAPAERPGPWVVYGRLGPLRFHNELDPQGGLRFAGSSSGPRLTGRLNIGIHRRFH